MLEEKSPFTSKRAYAFKMYSGKSMNDLGNYDACNQVPKMHYSLIVAALKQPRINFYVGLCLPEYCDKDSLGFAKEYIGALVPGAKATMLFPYEELPEYNGSAYALISFIALLTLLGLLGIFVELTPLGDKRPGELGAANLRDPRRGLSLEQRKRTWALLLLSFSFSYNLKKLCKLQGADRGKSVAVLNGVRVLSLCWIIMGHQIGVNATSTVSNPENMGMITEGFLFVIVSRLRT